MSKPNALRILQQCQVNFEVIHYQYNEHSTINTIAQQNNIDPSLIYKTLVCKGNVTGPIVALVAGHQSLSFKKLASISSNRKVTLVKIEQLPLLTGYIRGGCSPLGMKKKYPTFIDSTVLELTRVYVNAGRRGILFSCHPQDLIMVSEAHSAILI